MIKHSVIVAAGIAVASCGGGGKNAETVDTVLPDTLASVPARVALPDTSLASVSMIKYYITTVDTATPPDIDSYEDPYATVPGVLTFRANQRRDADMHGHVSGRPSRIDIDWKFTTETDERETDFGQWGGGTGWTGQPIYIEWPDSVRRRQSKHLAAGFSGREIIVGSLAARLYFIDYATGKASREPLDVGNPIKGTISLDPSLNGNLYVGHGVPAQRPFGALVVNLDRHEVADVWPEDPKAYRMWNAYDSSPVRVGQFVFRPGENGIIYKYVATDRGLRLHSYMLYTRHGASPGIESSMSVYRNYGFTTDNHGYVVCTNLDNLRPVWVYASGDDNDATTVCEVEAGIPYVYCSSEIDRQGEGHALMAKLNGLDGMPVWETRIPGARFDKDEKHFDGGFYASPLPGTGNCSHLLFSNVVYNDDGQNGAFVAFDRRTGNIVYTTPLRVYAWSSPVGFLDDEGHMYVVTADCGGNVYLIDGLDGMVIARRSVGANFESSPVVVGNTLVVGSRGKSIYKLSIN